jgi:prophage DNA circulation protein
MASKIDWDAVERDYRTDKFTLRELESKHSVSYAQISRYAKKHDWKKDLSKKIKDATSEALLQESVTKAQKEVTETVSVAVEVNLNIIRKHRSLLNDLTSDVLGARARLNEMALTVCDIKEAATYVQAVGNLAGAAKTLIDQERKAFGLDEEANEGNPVDAALKQLAAWKKNGDQPN